MIDDEIMEVLRYCTEMLKIIESKYADIMKTEDDEDDILVETTKKLTIFVRSVSRMKASGHRLAKYYSLFELILPSIASYF